MSDPIPQSLLAAVPELAGAATLLVALDFDGTLSPIVSQPHLARPLPGVLDVLGRLNDPPDTRVVLLSGRSRADLASVSGAAGVAELIGSHGQEHEGPQRELTAAESAQLGAARQDAQALAAEVPGAMVEDKPAGFAVHVRNADPDAGEALLGAVLGIASGHSLNALTGKMVVELSALPMDKGSALAAMVARLGNPRVIFIGDDVTDEAAMAVLGPDDVTVKVGPGESIAAHRVADPQAVLEVLEVLAGARGR